MGIATMTNQDRIIIACIEGNYQRVLSLLEALDVGINQVDSFGRTLLFAACQAGHTNIVNLLLQQPGIDINQTTNHNKTAFYGACENNHIDIVKLLLQQRRININKAANGNRTPLFEACQKGHIGIVKLLLNQRDLEINQHANIASPKNIFYYTPLSVACELGYTEIFELFLEQRDVIFYDTYFSLTCKKGHVDIVKLFLKNNRIRNINKQNIDGETCFYHACHEGHIEIVKLLLEQNDIDINQAANDGSTPLLKAINWNHTEIIKLLLAKKNIIINARAYDLLERKQEEYGAFIDLWTQSYAEKFNDKVYNFLQNYPNAIFDFPKNEAGSLDIEQAMLGYHVLRHLIRCSKVTQLSHFANKIDISFVIEQLLKIPSVNYIVTVNAKGNWIFIDDFLKHFGPNLYDRSNELLRLAHELGYKLIAARLMRIPEIQHTAKVNEYYQSQSTFNLWEVIQNNEKVLENYNQPSIMERMPPEILEFIFDNLSIGDFLSARLVCKKWALHTKNKMSVMNKIIQQLRALEDIENNLSIQGFSRKLKTMLLYDREKIYARPQQLLKRLHRISILFGVRHYNDVTILGKANISSYKAEIERQKYFFDSFVFDYSPFGENSEEKNNIHGINFLVFSLVLNEAFHMESLANMSENNKFQVICAALIGGQDGMTDILKENIDDFMYQNKANELFVLACSVGNFDISQWLEERCIDDESKRNLLLSHHFLSFILAVDNGHFDMANWIWSKLSDVDKAEVRKNPTVISEVRTLIKKSIHNMDIPTIKFLFEEAYFPQLAKNYHLEDSEYHLIIERGSRKLFQLCPPRNDNVKFDLEYIFNHQDKGCEIFRYFSDSVREGNIDLVKYFWLEQGLVTAKDNQKALSYKDYYFFKYSLRHFHYSIFTFLWEQISFKMKDKIEKLDEFALVGPQLRAQLRLIQFQQFSKKYQSLAHSLSAMFDANQQAKTINGVSDDLIFSIKGATVINSLFNLISAIGIGNGSSPGTDPVLSKLRYRVALGRWIYRETNDSQAIAETVIEQIKKIVEFNHNQLSREHYHRVYQLINSQIARKDNIKYRNWQMDWLRTVCIKDKNDRNLITTHIINGSLSMNLSSDIYKKLEYAISTHDISEIIERVILNYVKNISTPKTEQAFIEMNDLLCDLKNNSVHCIWHIIKTDVEKYYLNATENDINAAPWASIADYLVTFKLSGEAKINLQKGFKSFAKVSGGYKNYCNNPQGLGKKILFWAKPEIKSWTLLGCIKAAAKIYEEKSDASDIQKSKIKVWIKDWKALDKNNQLEKLIDLFEKGPEDWSKYSFKTLIAWQLYNNYNTIGLKVKQADSFKKLSKKNKDIHYNLRWNKQTTIFSLCDALYTEFPKPIQNVPINMI